MTLSIDGRQCILINRPTFPTHLMGTGRHQNIIYHVAVVAFKCLCNGRYSLNFKASISSSLVKGLVEGGIIATGLKGLQG